MMMIAAAPAPGRFYVVCKVCLWTPGNTLREDDAFNTADSHKDKCPGGIPATATKTQITKARKIINGEY